jgi:hypothetical protein
MQLDSVRDLRGGLRPTSMMTRLAHMADRIWHMVETISHTRSAISAGSR